jgi:urease accessory protein
MEALLRVHTLADSGGEAAVTLTLDWEQRQRSRLRARLDDGREVALLLPRGTRLRGGDMLRAVDGTLIRVRAALEQVSCVESADAGLLMRACYHLANRHVPVQIGTTRLCYRHDPVLDDMLRGLGLTVGHALEPFEAESGAYSEHHHASSHHHHEPDEADETGHAALVDASLLSLLQLASGTLPVGSFAYSQGLEQAVELGWVRGEEGAQDWILGLLREAQARQEVPLFARLYRAWQAGDMAAVERWNACVVAMRDTAEARAEERNTGAALARLLAALEPEARVALADPSYLAMYALAAVRWRILLETAAGGWLWSWCQQQVAAAIKLVPLGQTAGQRILRLALADIPGTLRRGLALADEEIGYTPGGLALAGALHEQQYTRLFLS